MEKAAFKDIGEFNEDGEKFWDFLQNKIYMPLAFEVPKQNSISEMLKQLVLLDDQHSQVFGKDQDRDYSHFQEKILSDFDAIQRSSAREKTDETSEQIIELLKKFHVHWNSLRLNDELDKVKGQTKTIMKKIM